MSSKKTSHFYDLEVWKKAHKLVLLIYQLVEGLPSKERFILGSQMLRAVISITSNIAEGYGRWGLKEKTQFYSMAKASLTELQNQILICKDVGYLTKVKYKKIWDQTVVVHKMLNALIRTLRSN